MAVWGNVVQQGMSQSAARSQQLSAGGIGRTLKMALESAMQDKKMEKQAQLQKEGYAAQAYYSRFPQAAGGAIGEEVPAGTGVIGTPEGMRATKVVYDEAGRPTQTYEAPGQLDDVSIGKMYSQYVMESQKHNALYSGREKYQIKIEPYQTWKKKHFPELDQPAKQADINLDDVPDEEIAMMLEQNGKAGTVENIAKFRENIRRIKEMQG
jgi:hypothetical protein